MLYEQSYIPEGATTHQIDVLKRQALEGLQEERNMIALNIATNQYDPSQQRSLVGFLRAVTIVPAEQPYVDIGLPIVGEKPFSMLARLLRTGHITRKDFYTHLPEGFDTVIQPLLPKLDNMGRYRTNPELWQTEDFQDDLYEALMHIYQKRGKPYTHKADSAHFFDYTAYDSKSGGWKVAGSGSAFNPYVFKEFGKSMNDQTHPAYMRDDVQDALHELYPAENPSIFQVYYKNADVELVPNLQSFHRELFDAVQDYVAGNERTTFRNFLATVVYDNDQKQWIVGDKNAHGPFHRLIRNNGFESFIASLDDLPGLLKDQIIEAFPEFRTATADYNDMPNSSYWYECPSFWEDLEEALETFGNPNTALLDYWLRYRAKTWDKAKNWSRLVHSLHSKDIIGIDNLIRIKDPRIPVRIQVKLVELFPRDFAPDNVEYSDLKVDHWSKDKQFQADLWDCVESIREPLAIPPRKDGTPRMFRTEINPVFRIWLKKIKKDHPITGMKDFQDEFDKNGQWYKLATYIQDEWISRNKDWRSLFVNAQMPSPLQAIILGKFTQDFIDDQSAESYQSLEVYRARLFAQSVDERITSKTKYKQSINQWLVANQDINTAWGAWHDGQWLSLSEIIEEVQDDTIILTYLQKGGISAEAFEHVKAIFFEKEKVQLSVLDQLDKPADERWQNAPEMWHLATALLESNGKGLRYPSIMDAIQAVFPDLCDPTLKNQLAQEVRTVVLDQIRGLLVGYGRKQLKDESQIEAVESFLRWLQNKSRYSSYHEGVSVGNFDYIMDLIRIMSRRNHVH